MITYYNYTDCYDYTTSTTNTYESCSSTDSITINYANDNATATNSSCEINSEIGWDDVEEELPPLEKPRLKKYMMRKRITRNRLPNVFKMKGFFFHKQ